MIGLSEHGGKDRRAKLEQDNHDGTTVARQPWHALLDFLGNQKCLNQLLDKDLLIIAIFLKAADILQPLVQLKKNFCKPLVPYNRFPKATRVFNVSQISS